MVVDSKQLISDIVLDTDNKMHKQCKFCGKLLHINDYTALYVNIVYKDIATAYAIGNLKKIIIKKETSKIIIAVVCVVMRLLLLSPL